MTDPEAEAFEAGPYFDASLRVRRYDDLGKVPGMKTAELEAYRSLIERFLIPQSGSVPA